MSLFAKEGIKFFGIHTRVKEIDTTELVVLEKKYVSARLVTGISGLKITAISYIYGRLR